MPCSRSFLAVALAAAILAPAIAAQNLGSLEVAGRVRVAGKIEKVSRKRFYLFRGGLEVNKALVDRLRNAEYTSKDCYYCKTKASPEFIAWLKAQDCESPYCRAISEEDTKTVPEFRAAYQKGLKQFRNKPDVARTWLTTNLTPNIREGFYNQQKSTIDKLLGGIKPIQSTMTDSVSVRAIFIDIPILSGKAEKFMISNIVPAEIGGKGIVWACEVEISGEKKVTFPLQVPEPNKMARNCEVFVRDLPSCTATSCDPK